MPPFIDVWNRGKIRTGRDKNHRAVWCRRNLVAELPLFSKQDSRQRVFRRRRQSPQAAVPGKNGVLQLLIELPAFRTLPVVPVLDPLLRRRVYGDAHAGESHLLARLGRKGEPPVEHMQEDPKRLIANPRQANGAAFVGRVPGVRYSKESAPINVWATRRRNHG